MGPDHAPKVAKKTAGRPKGLAARRPGLRQRVALSPSIASSSPIPAPKNRNGAAATLPIRVSQRLQILARTSMHWCDGLPASEPAPLAGPSARRPSRVTRAMGKFRLFDECRLFAGHRHGSGRGNTPPETCDAIRNAQPRPAGLSISEIDPPKASCQPPKGRLQKVTSICPLRGLLIAGQNLVCISRPGNREQRQNRNNGQRSHAVMIVFDCGQKRQSLAHFRDEPEKQSWPPSSA